MSRPGPDEQVCEHGYDTWRKTRDGRPLCPFCRRLAKREANETAAWRARFAQPHLDIPALVAHDDSLNNVISLTAERAARRRRPKEI